MPRKSSGSSKKTKSTKTKTTKQKTKATKISNAKKLRERIGQLDEIDMYSLYQLLEKYKVQYTQNNYGVHFDLMGLSDDIYKVVETFVDKTLERNQMFNE